MANSISNLSAIITEYNNFKSAYNIGGSAIANVVTTGTILYNDANFAAEFPNNITAYKAYLVALNSAITTFLANLPVEPPLVS